MNTTFGVKPNIGFTITRPPPSFSGLDIRPLRFKDTFHGPNLLRQQQQQHHNIKFSKGWCEEEPFSLRNLRMPLTEVVCERTPSKISTYEKLEPDMILLKNYVSLKDQVDIVYLCDKWGAGHEGFEGFHEPYFKQGEDYRIHMWFGDPKMPPVPLQLISFAKKAVEDAQAHFTKLPSFLMFPNFCLACFYPLSCGRISVHQIPDDGGRGSPVVSIFIGDAAEFVYRQSGATMLKRLLLQSGDVLIYGGRSRNIYHGITQICQGMPLPLLQETGLKSGCLNLNVMECL